MNKPNPALNKRIQSVLNTPFHDKEFLACIESFSDFDVSNSQLQIGRKNYRSFVEKQVIESHTKVIAVLDEFEQLLDAVESDVSSLSERVEVIDSTLNEAKSAIEPFVQELNSFQNKQKQISSQKQFNHVLLDKFTLTEEQEIVFRTGPSHSDFFALSRLLFERVRMCEELLLVDDRRISLPLYQHLSQAADTALERAHRWVLVEGTRLADLSPAVLAQLKEALNLLSFRPALLKRAVDDLTAQRSTQLGKQFQIALTTGGVQARPLQLLAHDPPRYTGDLLSYMHQAMVEEREVITYLFTPPTPSPSGNSPQYTSGDAARYPILPSAVLADSYGNMGKLVSSHIHQSAQRVDDTVLLYKQANIISFYSDLLASFVPRQSALMRDLTRLQESVLGRLRAVVLGMLKELDSGYAETENSQLSPTSAVLEVVHVVENLLTAHQNSSINDTFFSALLSQVLGAVLSHIYSLHSPASPAAAATDSESQTPSHIAASASSRACTHTLPQATAVLNALAIVKHDLSRHPAIASELGHVDVCIQSQLARIADLQAFQLLEACGFDPKKGTPPVGDAAAEERALTAFYRQIVGEGDDVTEQIPSLSHVEALPHRNYLVGAVLDRLLQGYTTVFTSHYGAQPEGMVAHATPAEMRILLGAPTTPSHPPH